MTRHLRGQSPVFEQVMLFAIGVGIFGGFLFFFGLYESHFTSEGRQMQLDSARYVLSLDIASLAARDGSSSVTEPVQKKAGDEPYKIRLNSTGLYLWTSEKSSWSNVYYMNELVVFEDSSVWSTGGKVTIIKEGNNIKLAE